MHARFVQSSILALAGGVVIVGSQSFTAGVTAWLAFSLGVAALALAAVPAVFGARRLVLGLDATIAALAGWAVVASLVFDGSLVRWLSFAEGAGFVTLALVGLAVDHVSLSRSGRRPAAREDIVIVATERPTAVAA